MPIRLRRDVLLALMLVALWVVASHAVPQSAKRSAPMPEQLANLSFTGIEKAPVLLSQGVWEGHPIAPGSSSRSHVELIQDFRLAGDLNGDDAEEAVVLLSSSSGGSGTFLYLAVAGWRGPSAANLATVLIGDRVQVRAGRITAGRIELDVVRSGPADPVCCPSQTAMRSWTLAQESLREEPVKNVGTLSLRDLTGREWRLTRLARTEAAPPEPRITLRVDENRVSGSGGCNRYFGEVRSGAPGQLTVGPLAGTRMACGEEIDRLENRFLTALQGASQYGFLAGKLALTYRKGDTVQTMLFEPR